MINKHKLKIAPDLPNACMIILVNTPFRLSLPSFQALLKQRCGYFWWVFLSLIFMMTQSDVSGKAPEMLMCSWQSARGLRSKEKTNADTCRIVTGLSFLFLFFSPKGRNWTLWELQVCAMLTRWPEVTTKIWLQLLLVSNKLEIALRDMESLVPECQWLSYFS